MRKRLLILLAGMLGLGPVLALEAPADWFSEQAAEGRLVGAVIATVDESGMHRRAFGVLHRETQAPVTVETAFEIGSITKVFTNLLLAELVAKGKVRYDTTIGDLLKDVEFANPEVAFITLEELATHHSGLPRIPDDHIPASFADPYADYDEAALRRTLANVRNGQPLTKAYSYSNLGVGLLGHLLGLVDGRGYRSALHAHVLEPLGLAETGFDCPQRGATGHHEGQPVPHWHFQALAGAGALCSTAADLARLIEAYRSESGLLAHDLADDLEIVADARDGLRVTRVWHVAGTDDDPIFWHNGGTGGFGSFLGFKAGGTGHIVLANTSNAGVVTQYGFRLSRAGVPDPVEVHAEDDAQLDAYLGHYALNPSMSLTVTREGDTLHVQATGQPRLTLARSADDRFNLLEVDAQLEFERAADGSVRSVMLHQEGMHLPGNRVDEPIKAKTFEVIDLDPDLLADYVGRYELMPGVIFTVQRDQDRLMVQLTGQPAYPVFPHGADQFHYRVVDAQLTFVRDQSGTVESLILHQHGRDQPAARLDD